MSQTAVLDNLVVFRRLHAVGGLQALRKCDVNAALQQGAIKYGHTWTPPLAKAKINAFINFVEPRLRRSLRMVTQHRRKYPNSLFMHQLLVQTPSKAATPHPTGASAPAGSASASSDAAPSVPMAAKRCKSTPVDLDSEPPPTSSPSLQTPSPVAEKKEAPQDFIFW